MSPGFLPSPPPVASFGPSGLNATAFTHVVCPFNARSSLPLVSQIRTGLAPSVVARVLASGLKQTLFPFIETISFPWERSHSLVTPSPSAEARVLPSGLNDTLKTKAECPAKVWIGSPVLASQILTVLSALADAIVFPSDP